MELRVHRVRRLVADAAITTGPKAAIFLQEAYRHYKTIAGWGDAVTPLAALGIPEDAPGVLLTAKAPDEAFVAALCEAIGWHRHWDR